MSEEDVGESTPRALRVALWLTGIWFIALIFLVAASEDCGGAEAIPWWYISDRYFACRPINEIGDFLAGAFAPVAFAWLVATVFIQSQELKAQRRELLLTRKEFELNRKVTTMQAEESRRQADYVLEQTTILQQERQDKDAEAADRLIDERWKYVKILWSQHLASKSYVENQRVHRSIPALDGQTGDAAISSLRTLRATIDTAQVNSEIMPDSFGLIVVALEDVIDVWSLTSAVKRAHLRPMKIDQILESMRAVRDVADQIKPRSQPTF